MALRAIYGIWDYSEDYTKGKAEPRLSSGAGYCHSCSDPQLQWLLVKAERFSDVARDN